MPEQNDDLPRRRPVPKPAVAADAKAKRTRIAAVKARRLDITTVKLKQPPQLVMVAVNQLDQLKIDHTYQRPENRLMVNQLVAVLEAGGKIADPVTVAVRPDGTKWIVDGQQRWAAHYLSEKPLPALLYHVEAVDDEKRLFSILNTNVRPHPNVRIRAWTGPSADLLTYLQESPESPVRQGIGFGAGGGYIFPASVLVNGLIALFVGSAGNQGSGSAEGLMRTLDVQVRDIGPKIARKLAQFYTLLCKQVFGDTRILRLNAVALALAAHQRWMKARRDGETPPMPDKGGLHRLKIMNWENWAPDQRRQWLPLLRDEILKRWK